MSLSGRTSIVLIVLDTVRAHNLRCYGYARETMPHLEGFGSRAALYRNAISPSPWTLPAHASLFTGLYPSQHGATELHRYLDPVIPVLLALVVVLLLGLGLRGSYRILGVSL